MRSSLSNVEVLRAVQDHNKFLQKLNGELKDENRDLKTTIEIFRKVISGQVVPVKYKRFEPGRFTAAEATVLQGAIDLTLRKGSWWKDAELFNFLSRRHLNFEYSLKTVARRCQELVLSGDLDRVAPATYIFYKKKEGAL